MRKQLKIFYVKALRSVLVGCAVGAFQAQVIGASITEEVFGKEIRHEWSEVVQLMRSAQKYQTTCRKVLRDTFGFLEVDALTQEVSAYGCGSEDSECNDFYNDLDNVPADVRRAIKKLIRKMDEKNWAQLLWDKEKMKKLGKKADEAHPLLFLGVICQENLKSHLRGILNVGYKKTAFLAGYGRPGFAARIQHEKERDTLEKYMVGLADLLGCSQDKLRQLIHTHNWSGLLWEVAG